MTDTVSPQNPIKEPEVNFERIVKAVPLGIGFFIFCGSLYLTTYYQCFHINIFNYLDTTEILTTFLYLIQDFACIFAFLIGEFLIIKLYLWCVSAWRKKYPQKSVPTKNKRDFTIIIPKETISIAIVITALIFCIVYVIKSSMIGIYSNYVTKNRDWMGRALIVFTTIGSTWIVYQYESGCKKAIRNMIIFFSLFFVSYSIAESVNRIEVTVNVPDRNTMVILAHDTIKTNEDYYYVGRTNKYVFFYDVAKERADVIPQDQIMQMSFGYKKP